MAKSAEFILEFDAKQVLVLEPFGPYFEEVIKRLTEQPDLQVVECSSLSELSVLARQVGVCLVVAHCNGAEEANGFFEMLESCRKWIDERKIRVVVTVSKDFTAILPHLVREGASEVIQQPISPKLLYKKIDRFINILPSRDQYGRLLPPRSRESGSGEDLSDEPVVTWRKPLEFLSDCWMAIEGKISWVPGARKWSVSLLGPPPKYGEWSESTAIPEEPVPQPEEPTWEWIPNDLTNDPFVRDEGAWKFRGEKPEYRAGLWHFKAYNLKLAFVQKDELRGSKVEGNDRELLVSENSDAARRAAELIENAIRGVPDYLQRVEPEEVNEPERHVSRMAMNPLFAALFLAELIQSRKRPPRDILKRFCDFLTQASWGTLVEIWVDSPEGWKCAQHNDLMDMALQQKIGSAPPYEKHVRSGELRSYLIEDQGRRVGAIVVKGKGFTERELEAMGKMVRGVLIGLDYAA